MVISAHAVLLWIQVSTSFVWKFKITESHRHNCDAFDGNIYLSARWHGLTIHRVKSNSSQHANLILIEHLGFYLYCESSFTFHSRWQTSSVLRPSVRGLLSRNPVIISIITLFNCGHHLWYEPAEKTFEY